MDDYRGTPYEVPTPHHLLDAYLARRGAVPEECETPGREVIEWFRAIMVSRDEAHGGVSVPDQLGARRVERRRPSPNDLRAAQRVTLELREVLAGSPLTNAPPQEDRAIRLVLRLFGWWMLCQELINESESQLINEAGRIPGAAPPARRLPRHQGPRRFRRW